MENSRGEAEWEGEGEGGLQTCRWVWCCEVLMAKRERGQTGDPDSIHGEREVRGDWQGCILEPNGGEMEAVEVREGRREGSGSTGY